MFTKNSKAPDSGQNLPRGRGRPRGTTALGETTRQKLYETATRLIAERGYEQTTLRDVAQAAGVSVGLLYRYFPNKRAVMLALYDELSLEHLARANVMPAGAWRDRFLFTLETSLSVLRPHRRVLSALIPVMISTESDGLFGSATAFSRHRVQRLFQDSVVGAKDAPRGELGAALGRLLYLIHLAVILWWLLDRSPNQRATTALVALTKQVLPMASLALKIKRVGAIVLSGDRLFAEALLSEGAPES
jgi:AcrR family transcriptional regulator